MNAFYDHLGFIMNYSEVRKSIFIPRYYNPEIPSRLDELRSTHQMFSIDDLVSEKKISLKAGKEIGKMAYGTGTIPFVRTSDISNWELFTDAKQGVSDSVYKTYSTNQDVQEEDILLVKDGTYLIGQNCLLTKYDLPLLFQSHIIKIRVLDPNPIDAYLLLAVLNSPIVKKQLRSIQFTADIIDTIGDRLKEIILPVPKDESLCKSISKEMKDAIETRAKYREELKVLPRIIQPPNIGDFEEQKGNVGFIIKYNNIKNNIFIPRYYDPVLEGDLVKLQVSHDLISIGKLVRDKVIAWETGIEIGKMAYGTGDIPFIRTSDIVNWEIKSDPKQSISESIYSANKQDVQAEDILLVRDGSYLIGSNCIITERDKKMLFCGGLYKLRIIDKSRLDPYLFLALLNTPIVRRQIRSKQFTRDIIDTIGKRLFEVLVPMPKSKYDADAYAASAKNIISKRIELRTKIGELSSLVEGVDPARRENIDDDP